MATPAFAHGTTSGSTPGSYALLIFPVMALVFALFLVFTHHKKGWNVLVIGGAGYLGSALVPKLLTRGHAVTVIDLDFHGDIFKEFETHMKFRQIAGDFKDPQTLGQALEECDAVIHLAPITDIDSPHLNAEMDKPADNTAFRQLLHAIKKVGIKRFILASSYAVYGNNDQVDITEDLAPEPTTKISQAMVFWENVLKEERAAGFVTCIIRSAAVCGYAPGPQSDVVVNGLTLDAFTNGSIDIPSGAVTQPYIHIDDIVDLYVLLLNQPDGKIDGKIFNAEAENLTFLELANIIKAAVGGSLLVQTAGSEKPNSCLLSSEKIRRELGFVPQHTVEEAVYELVARYRD